MAFGRSTRQSVITKSPMVGGASPLVGTSPAASSSASKRQSLQRRSAVGDPQMVETSPMVGAGSEPSPPSKKLGARLSAFKRTKSQPRSDAAAPIRTGGPSPGFTGPSPGSWASPAWSASPNSAPAYLNASPADFNKVPAEGQWWLLEARRMREETRRIHTETVRLKSLVADRAEELQKLESRVQSKTEHADRLASQLQAVVDKRDILQPELKKSEEMREKQRANIGLLNQRIQESIEDRRYFQEKDMERLVSELETSRSKSRDLARQLRQAQAGLEVAEKITATEGARVYVGRKFRAEATSFCSELESQNRRREELEESLRQALKQAQAEQVDMAELKRLGAKLKVNPLDDEYDVLENERNALREEVKKLNAEIQKMQGEVQTCLNCGTTFAPAARFCRKCGAARASFVNEVESSGCDNDTICVLTPRSQITDGSLEASEANFRLERDLQGRLKKNATDDDVQAAEAQLQKVYLSHADKRAQSRPKKNSVRVAGQPGDFRMVPNAFLQGLYRLYPRKAPKVAEVPARDVRRQPGDFRLVPSRFLEQLYRRFPRDEAARI